MYKWLSLMVFVFSVCFGEEMKHNFSVCTIFKDETKFIKEWIEYHRLVGVDHFYLYSNGSEDTPETLLEEYIEKGIVTFQKWLDPMSHLEEEKPLDWALSIQTTAYENAILMRKDETKWLVFLDMNEFLVPSKDTLVEVLKKNDHCSGVELTSRFFDASLSQYFSDKNLVLETVDLIDAHPKNVYKTVKKMVVKPSKCKKFNWPPYECLFSETDETVSLGEEVVCINTYENRKKNHLHHHSKKIRIDNRMLSKDEETKILGEGFEFEDQKKAVFRFLPKLREKLGD